MKTTWNKKPKKKRKKANIEKRLDKVWGDLVKLVGKCEKCGARDKQLHPHHIIGRVNRVMRWDRRNGICLCPHCHTFGVESAHTDSKAFEKFMLGYRPDDWHYIQEKKKGIKPTRQEKEDLLIVLKEAYIKESGEKY